MGSGRGEVGNGVNRVLLVDGIGGLIAGSRSSDFGLAILAMTEGKIPFKVRPCLVGFSLAFPDFAVFWEHAGRKY
jgi:hypothetical protein